MGDFFVKEEPLHQFALLGMLEIFLELASLYCFINGGDPTS